MKDESAIFIPKLLAVAPELKPLCDKQIEDWGEVQNYSLMGEITRFIESLIRVKVLTTGRLSEEAEGLLLRLLTFFEGCLNLPEAYVEEFTKSPEAYQKEFEKSPDVYRRELVLVFLEMVNPEGEFFESLKALMGPRMPFVTVS